MSKIKVVLNKSGVRSMLLSDELKSVLEERANEVISKTSGSYETNSYNGRNRTNVSIYTSDEKTYRQNKKDNELLKALR